MAINTAQKRASIATISAVWNAASVIPTGALDDQETRQQIAWSYSGILALAPALEITEAVVRPPGGRRRAPQILVSWLIISFPSWRLWATTQRSPFHVALPLIDLEAKVQVGLRAQALFKMVPLSLQGQMGIVVRQSMILAMKPLMMKGHGRVFYGSYHVHRLLEDEAELELVGGKR